MKKALSSIPRHVAIIPDGNRRWARENSLSVKEGHEKGTDAFRRIAHHAADQGVQHLSIWGMSVDNLTRRNPVEVANLMRIFRKHFLSLLNDEEIHKRGTRIRIFGHWREKFPVRVKKTMEEVQDATKHYTNNAMNFFLAYNGTDEMMRAVQGIVDDGMTKITPDVIKQHLFTKDIPSVDLVIRTGGEPHLSNGFMMWDAADAQLHFTDTFWPAFSTDEFDAVLAEYALRERRLGK